MPESVVGGFGNAFNAGVLLGPSAPRASREITMDALEMAMPVVVQSGAAAAQASIDARRRAIPENGSGGPMLALRAKEAVCRVNMPGAASHVAEWDGVRARLLTMARGGTCEWEFRLPSLVIMTQPDGGTTGCEWTDGGEMHKVVGLPPHSVLVNPADRYLCIRRRMQAGARLLLLTINPNELERPKG